MLLKEIDNLGGDALAESSIKCISFTVKNPDPVSPPCGLCMLEAARSEARGKNRAFGIIVKNGEVQTAPQ